MTEWLAGIGEVPLHLSRFFPRYNMTEKLPTPKGTLQRLTEIASRKLKYVHLGNM
jgi:pyruvate formate lyase activating enzyme